MFAIVATLHAGSAAAFADTTHELQLAENLFNQFSVEQKTSRAGKPFAIEQQDGADWLVRPSGERFFSFGVCVATMGASRKEFDPHNPGYAAWQHYADSNQWAAATLKRLDSWGFTTIGGLERFSNAEPTA
jgi:hypothetical protein